MCSTQVGATSRRLFGRANLPRSVHETLVGTCNGISFSCNLACTGGRDAFRVLPSGGGRRVSFVKRAVSLDTVARRRSGGIACGGRRAGRVVDGALFLNGRFLIASAVTIRRFGVIRGRMGRVLNFRYGGTVSSSNGGVI